MLARGRAVKGRVAGGARVASVPPGTREGEHPPQALTTAGSAARRVPTVAAVSLTSPSRPPRPGALRACIAALALACAAAVLGANPASAVDVVGDDGRDLYSGTGGTVWPAREWHGDESGRQDAAACEGCAWRVTSSCTRLEFDTGSCPGSHVGCPAGSVRVRVWLQQAGEPWRLVGSACLGDAPPVTVADLGGAVRDRAEQLLPPLRAGSQPADGALVGLPAVFRTGQPADGIVGADLSVLGFDVVLDARVRWHWAWGDGSEGWTAAPGGRWPDASVSHTYRRAGAVQARVTSVWRGQYVVDGLGPFAVPGTLAQEAVLVVDVREARAVLVG